MPPKTRSLGVEEELEEIRKSLDFMSGELSRVAKQQDMLRDLMDEIKQLKNVVKEKDKKINNLERRIEDFEQYTRMDDLIINGLETAHRSYARATAGDNDGEDAPVGELQTLDQQVIKFLLAKNSSWTTPTAMVTQRGFLLNLGLLACVLLIVFCCWNARSLQNKGERQHQRQEQRKALLRNICHHYKEGFSGGKYSLDSLSSKDMDNLLVDDKYGIIYCYIPKVACTNWKKVMMALKHEEPLPDPRSIHDELTNMRDLLNPLNSFSRTEINIKMKHYTKFMFVRDPFVRLVATYREKFLRHSEYIFYNYAWDILRRYDARPDLPKSANEAFGAGLKPSFSSFIHYLVDPQTEKSGPFEPHWRQYYQLCHPCVIQYDFIGHQETLNEDAEELLEMLHLKNDIKFPPAYVNVTSPDSMKKWFEGVPLATKKKLFKIYETDFKLFGYNQPDYLISE